MAGTFRFAHATAEDWQVAAKACLAELGATPPGANLGFLYVTDGFAHELFRILACFREATGVEQWAGSVDKSEGFLQGRSFTFCTVWWASIWFSGGQLAISHPASVF